MRLKNFTLLMLSAALAGGMCQEADAAKLPAWMKHPAKVLKERKVARKGAHSMLKVKAAEAAAAWRACTQKAYGWNGEDWELEETYKITYDELGQKKVQTVTDIEGYVTKETYTWNENGQLATRFTEVDETGEGMFVNSSRLSREYDSRLTSFITFNDQQMYDGSEWIPSNCYKQTITRDEAGNITLMERAVYFQGIFDPTYRLYITYGEDGKATTIVESDLTYDYETGEYAWVESGKYTDIEWVETDGQITGVSEFEDLFLGANKMKSAKMIDEDMTVDLNVEYTGDGFTATMAANIDGIDVTSKAIYAELDFADGSTDKGWTLTEVYDVIFEGEVMEKEVSVETCIYTADDLIILEQLEYGDGEFMMIESKLEGEVEYDENHGYPLSWTLSEYDWDTEEMMPTFRAEFSDYINATSSVKDIMSSDNPTPVYFNLQGRKVENPSAGLYIRVTGDKAEKVAIR